MGIFNPKLIIIILIVWFGYVLFKKFRKPPNELSQKPSSNKMLACSVCKTHIPENEAILQDGKVYCSKSCL